MRNIDLNRKKTRFIANFDGFYRFKNSSEWQECFIYDISDTGTLIRIKQTLMIEDQLEICLDINNKKDTISGVVANVKGQVAGIEFTTEGIAKIVDRAIKRAFIKTSGK